VARLGSSRTTSRTCGSCAGGLFEAHAESGENERIEVVRWPLAELDDALEECRDAKTLIGLCWLARRLNG